MKRLLYLLCAASLALASCTTVKESDPANDDIRFEASFEAVDPDASPATRTYVDGSGETLRMHWTADDAVSIFFSTYGEKYLFQGQTGDRGGAFAKAASTVFTGGFEMSRYYAVYPYAETTSMDESGVVHYTFPDTQTYAEGSFGLGANPMVAATADCNDYHLIFKNVCSFLRLQIYGGATITQIRLSGNAEETLCGTADISAGYETLPQTVMTGEGKTLTLNCGAVTTSTDSEAPTSFWLAIPPTAFPSGFTVEMTDDKGNVTTKASNKSYVFARNEVTPMKAFEMKPQSAPEPPTPEIPDLLELEGNLPVLYVFTPDAVPVVDKVNWIADSRAILKTADGTITDLGKAQIKGRGNTTWNMAKKPYALKLDKKAGLLGMPKDKRWNLLANYVDRTRLRNDVALELGRRLGPDHGQSYMDWTPRGKFVEFVLNNVHMGNYYLVEHIKVAENRVPITAMKSTDIEEPAITGGYLIECSTEMDEVNQFYTNSFPDVYGYKDGLHGGSNGTYKLPVMIKDPDEETLVTEQFNWIKNYINGIQSNIVNNNGGWTGKVDMDSFICWMFIQEVVGNYEPFHPKSCYMHKNREGKLVMGPLWDFDYGTFKANWNMTPVYHYSIWYPYMLRNSTFKARVKELYPTVRHLLRDVANNYVDAVAAEIKSSVERDWEMWPTTTNANGDINKTFDEAVASVKGNLNRRLDQMTTEVNNM